MILISVAVTDDTSSSFLTAWLPLPGVSEDESDASGDDVSGAFAYTQLEFFFAHREQMGLRRSQRSFAFAQALQDLRRVGGIVRWQRLPDCTYRSSIPAGSGVDGMLAVVSTVECGEIKVYGTSLSDCLTFRFQFQIQGSTTYNLPTSYLMYKNKS